MCMEDVNIARATRNNHYTVSGTNLAIPANSDRISIKLTCLPGVNSGSGMVLTQPITVIGSATPISAVLGAINYSSANIADGVADVNDFISIGTVGIALLGPLILRGTNNLVVHAVETYLPVNAGQSLDIDKLP